MANPVLPHLLTQGVPAWNAWRTAHPDADVALRDRPLQALAALGGRLVGIDLHGALLAGADLGLTDLGQADLRGADLQGAQLNSADLPGARLQGANLCGANLRGATLTQADLRDTMLVRARLAGAVLADANLTRANLAAALAPLLPPDEASVVAHNDPGMPGDFSGVSAWNVQLGGAVQNDLRIAKQGEPEVTLDDLEVAQFIHLMLNHTKIRNMIDSITAKGVLILGCFADPQRKAVRDGLRAFDLLPMVFDFDRPTDKDDTETVQTLAGLSLCVIADVTSPKSTPLELETTVKQVTISYLPILDTRVDARPFATLPDLQKSFPRPPPTLQYASADDLLHPNPPPTHLIDRALAKREELRQAKSTEPAMVGVRKRPATP